MKAINHFEQNRSIHLALRDVYYERAIELLSDVKHASAQALSAGDYEEILFILRRARKHGSFAVRNNERNVKDGQFSKFINMLAGNVKAVLSMLNLKDSVEAKDGFFFSFLEINQASVALQAEEYERRARDILRCMLKTLEISNVAFEELKRVNYEDFTTYEREQYDKATTHYKGLINIRMELPRYKKRTRLFS